MCVDDRGELRVLATELPAAVGIGGDLRTRPLRLDLVEPLLDFVEPQLEAHCAS
jgi:hypothetical protein